jgi:hypothetical protein
MNSAGLVENNSRKHELKRSRTFWVFSATGVLLLALTVIVAVLSTQWVTYPEGGEFVEIHAEKLIDKPKSYISLSNPDPYLLEAMREPGKYVDLRPSDETQIDEQIGTNSTSYVEFEGNYYKIHQSLVFVDYPAPHNRGEPFQLPMLALWMLWGISAGVVDLYRRQNSQNQLKTVAVSPS